MNFLSSALSPNGGALKLLWGLFDIGKGNAIRSSLFSWHYCESIKCCDKTVYAAVPPRAEFRLTQAGKDLFPVMDMMVKIFMRKSEAAGEKKAASDFCNKLDIFAIRCSQVVLALSKSAAWYCWLCRIAVSISA
jgi:hypothetical protein